MSTAARRRAAVLGHPIAHSLSPVLHRAAYEALGLRDWSYEAHDVDEAGLERFLAGLDDSWAGLSLTMPLKRAVGALLAHQTALATAVGAVNTVLFGDDGTTGANTDVHGMVAALRGAGVALIERAAVIGGGATAASALAALAELGCRAPVVHVRSASRCADLLAAAGRLQVAVRLAGVDPAGLATSAGVPVVVSTVPAPAAAEHAEAVVGICTPGRDGVPQVLLDVAYDPWPTPLAAGWQARGGLVVSGLEMLVHQAGEQVRLMTGKPGPVAAMRAAGEAELARRAAGPLIGDHAVPPHAHRPSG